MQLWICGGMCRRRVTRLALPWALGTPVTDVTEVTEGAPKNVQRTKGVRCSAPALAHCGSGLPPNTLTNGKNDHCNFEHVVPGGLSVNRMPLDGLKPPLLPLKRTLSRQDAGDRYGAGLTA